MRSFIVLAALCIAASQAQNISPEDGPACARKVIQDAVNEVVKQFEHVVSKVPAAEHSAVEEMRQEVRKYEQDMKGTSAALKPGDGVFGYAMVIRNISPVQSELAFALGRVLIKHGAALGEDVVAQISEDIENLSDKLIDVGRGIFVCGNVPVLPE